MEALIRDLMEIRPGIALDRELLKLICPHGVVIGGIYKHFKGDLYVVTGFTRPANDWENLHVKYVQTDNVSHDTSRPLSEFLDNVEKPNYRGPRFKLVSV